MQPQTSAAIEEYLETIYRLSQETEPVPLSVLAEWFAISPVSVNEMVRKMAERGLVSYEPYHGVSLTPQGRSRAETIVRRHRLWERLLADVLGYPWDQVHEEACRLEHATSPELEEHLASYLAEPSTCPHGMPLPGESSAALDTSLPLDALAVGQPARVVAVTNEDTAFLGALDRAGLRPGAVVQVLHREPAIQSLTCVVDDVKTTLWDRIASRIMVIPILEA